MALRYVELAQLLPSDWQIRPGAGVARIVAPSRQDAKDLIKGASQSLKQSADRLGAEIHILVEGSDRPIRVIKSSTAQPQPNDRQPAPQISSYTPSSISPDASFEAVMDFIKGAEASGLVATVTAMGSDRCLLVNSLQVSDRGGGWTGAEWHSLDFKKLWRDSFLNGNENYYGRLVELVQRDRHIPSFQYLIRRPSGSLARYESSYHLVNNFLGCLCRIAISKQGNWEIVEDGHLEG